MRLFDTLIKKDHEASFRAFPGKYILNPNSRDGDDVQIPRLSSSAGWAEPRFHFVLFFTVKTFWSNIVFSFHLVIVHVMCLHSQVQIADYLLLEMGHASRQIQREVFLLAKRAQNAPHRLSQKLFTLVLLSVGFDYHKAFVKPFLSVVSQQPDKWPVSRFPFRSCHTVCKMKNLNNKLVLNSVLSTVSW